MRRGPGDEVAKLFEGLCMRAQLAVTSLILFGVVLIVIGFLQFPYVAQYSDIVVVQTYSTNVSDVEEATVTTRRDTSVQSNYTTVIDIPLTTTFTTKTTRTNYFTTHVETTLVETRYSDLSFMSFMGSFLVFVGILFMVLMLKTMPKPYIDQK